MKDLVTKTCEYTRAKNGKVMSVAHLYLTYCDNIILFRCALVAAALTLLNTHSQPPLAMHTAHGAHMCGCKVA